MNHYDLNDSKPYFNIDYIAAICRSISKVNGSLKSFPHCHTYCQLLGWNYIAIMQ